MVAAAYDGAIAYEQDRDASQHAVTRITQHVQVGAAITGHALPGGHVLQFRDLVTVTRRLLVVLRGRCILHALHEGVDDRLVAAFEELHGRGKILRVLVLGDVADAGGGAALDLILQAGPRSIAKKALVARPDHEQLLQLVQCVPDGCRAWVRPEVAARPFASAAVKA